MNTSQFFENRECSYYPCHKGMKELNCMFCYCPFYSWEKCPGENHYKENSEGRRIKVCTDCQFPHIKYNYSKIIEYLKLGEESFAERAAGNCEKPCNNHIKEPVFYGIGVGPGNPELVTIEAQSAILNADVLILPADSRDNCRAYEIAKRAIPEIADKECVFMPFPMSMKEPELSDFHNNAANRAEAILNEGKSVGFLTIGDVSIYSTFVYIERILKEKGCRTKYISGITSFCAAAARLGMPLTLGSEELHIIPGNCDITEALSLTGTLVFMKSGRKLSELKKILVPLEEEGSLEVKAVSNCGMDSEIIALSAKELTEENGYLTVVIVKRINNPLANG